MATDKQNLFIFVADALRYDHLHESVAEKGSVVRTVAPATWTPPSFSSLLTGLHPQNHNVNSFSDTLDPQHTTLFDFFENHSFFEHPDDALLRVLENHINEPEDLDEMEPPFAWIERSQETHAPYCEMGHGGEYSVPEGEPTSGREYYRKLEEEGRWPEIYEEAARKNAEHFLRHVEELKDRGLYDDTLIIYTSDHGEFINERSFGIKRIDHGHPMHRVLLDVPTVFLNADIDVDVMRSIDIVPTALSILGKQAIGNGVDVREQNPTTAYCQGEGQAKQVYRWKATEDGPKCMEPVRLRAGKLVEDFKSVKVMLERRFNRGNEGESSEGIIDDVEV